MNDLNEQYKNFGKIPSMMTDIELRIKNKVKKIEVRIINLVNREKNREEKDAAGVYIPTTQDAMIRLKAFKECLEIVRSESL